MPQCHATCLKHLGSKLGPAAILGMTKVLQAAGHTMTGNATLGVRALREDYCKPSNRAEWLPQLSAWFRGLKHTIGKPSGKTSFPKTTPGISGPSTVIIHKEEGDVEP